MHPVDTSRFQFGVISDEDYDETDERRRLDELAQRVRGIIRDQPWAPPIQDLLLAFGVGDVLGLYLVRFEHPCTMDNGDRRDEMWVVAGDLPTIFFSTDCGRTRAEALRVYCDLADEWADAVLDGADISDCYEMHVEPTEEHARMLKSRAGTIRRKFIPYVDDPPSSSGED
jgi:hypothetical protein